MDLAKMRRQGGRHLIAYCLNDACRHQAVVHVSCYPADTPVRSFGGVHQVRSTRPAHRRAAELEGSAGLN
jgi:hypothetical protein